MRIPSTALGRFPVISSGGKKRNSYDDLGTLAYDFEGGATGWSAVHSATLSAESAHVHSGSAGLRITYNGVAMPGAIKTGLNIDCSGPGGIGLWVFFDGGAAPHREHVELALGNSGSHVFSTSFGLRLGWNFVALPKNAFAASTGSPSWANPITYMGAYFKEDGTADLTGAFLSVDSLLVGVDVGRPTWLFTFDDGKGCIHKDCFPYMNALGQKGTYYINHIVLSDLEEGLNLVRLQEMDAAGWLIANHTYAHTSLSTATYDACVAAIADQETWLTSLGFARGAKHLSYPGTTYGRNALLACEARGILTARAAESYGYMSNVLSRPWQLASKTDDAATLATWQARIDELVAHGGTFCYYGHEVNDGDHTGIALATFQGICDYLDANNVWCPAVDEWYAACFAADL